MAEFKCEKCDRVFNTEEAFKMHNDSKHYVKPKKQINKKKAKNWGIFIVVVIGIMLAGYALNWNSQRPGEHDAFASCLSENGVKMFGAYWCPNCQDQKTLFGRSWDKVNYIECSLPNQGGQNELCNQEGIEKYPTWEFSNGDRQTGVINLQQLSLKTGCSL